MTPPAEDITLGEVYRGLQQLRTESASQFATLNRVMGERLVGREYYTAMHEALQHEVNDLKDRVESQERSRRTLWVTVLGSMVAGAASYISLLIGAHPAH